MNNSVIIKGMRSGISIILDNELDFEELKAQVADKFASSREFLGRTDIAVSFEGRQLDIIQIRELLEIIDLNSDLNVIYVIDNNIENNEAFEKEIEAIVSKHEENAGFIRVENASRVGEFYKGSLRSGQSITSDNGVIIVGDVNAGANVVAKGNIVILGTILGTAHAGCDGNHNAFVAALDMRPTQIRIGDMIARSADKKGKLLPARKKPEIAYANDGNIYIEEISREVLNDLKF